MTQDNQQPPHAQILLVSHVFRFLLSIILISSMVSAGFGAFAAPTDNNSPERNAFTFATRKDWGNALAYAHQSSNPVLVKLITWEYALDPSSGATFEEITDFMAANPAWPEQKKLHLRAEIALFNSNVSAADIIDWFAGTVPISGIGKIVLAGALENTAKPPQEKIRALIESAWRDGDFDEPEENKIMADYAAWLRKEDYNARISRLLWEERIGAAKRMIKLVSPAQQKLFNARIALQENKRFAILSVAQVPSALKNDPGLIYDRMIYRARHDDDNGVRDMLLIAPSHVPYPEKWWRHREFEVLKAIDEKKYTLAKKLLSGHGQVEGSSLADAIWLRGWLNTEFMSEPKAGYKDFTDMYALVHYPVSKARAAYWAGRAAQKLGDAKSARQWYSAGAAYPTTFYGQLAALKVKPAATLDIPEHPNISAQAKNTFEKNDVAQGIKLAISLGELNFAAHLIAMVIDNSEDETEIAQVSELGVKAGHTALSVKASKKALQQNVVLIDAGYPTPATPAEKPVEPALTLAITRQESEFDPAARSPSGALGMMQLLPGTAKEVAQKQGLGYATNRLFEPDYNMTLGSFYLSRLINSYDGSYVMAIAAYNAGPGNVHHWVHDFGTPGSNNSIDEAVNWIEKIPYHETRNYVQRVLENLQVFRYVVSNEDAPVLKLGEDLAR